MFEYIARHWAAMQQMRREREAEEASRADISDWNNCESWSDFLNRRAQEDQGAVAIWAMLIVAILIVLALAVQEWDAAVVLALR